MNLTEISTEKQVSEVTKNLQMHETYQNDIDRQFLFAEGYTFIFSREIRPTSLKAVEEFLIELLKTNPVAVPSSSGPSGYILFNSVVGDTRVLVECHPADMYLDVAIGTNDLEIALKISATLYDLFCEAPSETTVPMRRYYKGNGAFGPFGIAAASLKKEELKSFNKNFYEIDLDWIDEYHAGTENIVIFCGEPGTGKTALARYIGGTRAKAIDYCTSKDILLVEEFWIELEKTDADYLILDDVDHELGDRESNEYMRRILTFADGLKSIDTKIIITTNTGFKHLDAALTRPGRCFDVFELAGLTLEKAKKIWIEDYHKTEEEFEFFFKGYQDNEISAAEIVSCSRRTKSRRRRQCDARLQKQLM